ncbi:MAG TPA: 4-hydroxyphenylacetate 3-hydroxylase N-terminal domain-containing protein [Geobacterales bacterium]|nr:4-hydroxyphenylacetate 3-hydroxylase N-terminal domain-containing protein [Geobacterales bacterium]
MRTSTEFIRSLEDGRTIYYRGKRIENINEHQILRIAALHAAKLFDYPNRIYEDEKFGQISKFFKIPKSKEDLLDRHELIYKTTMFCNGIFNISQAIGSDALFALTIISRKLDKKYGTDYSKRIEKYYEEVAKKDLTLAVAQTDVKGDRSKRPSEQIDPDMYLHVVKVDSNGITVKGAKAHTTQSIVADEIIVIPTRAMRSEEKDFSIAFAVPTNAKGLKMYCRPVDEVEGNTSSVLSKKDYEIETITVFDNVFVPWDRVFLFREYEFAGALATLFATFHRFTAISYRSATANLYLGAAIKAAEANGVLKEKHVRDDILEIVMYKEIMKISALAAAIMPRIDEEVMIPNPIYTNIGKLYSNSRFVEVIKALVDVSGGIIGTMPAQEDFESEQGQELEKYLRGALDGRKRIEIMKLAKELASSSYAGYMITLMAHAEGSIEASKLELERSYDYGEALELVEKVIS